VRAPSIRSRSFAAMPRSGEPGFHNRKPCDYGEYRGYGFRPSLGSAGMTAGSYAALSRTLSGTGSGLLAEPSIDSTVMKIMS